MHPGAYEPTTTVFDQDEMFQDKLGNRVTKSTFEIGMTAWQYEDWRAANANAESNEDKKSNNSNTSSSSSSTSSSSSSDTGSDSDSDSNN